MKHQIHQLIGLGMLASLVITSASATPVQTDSTASKSRVVGLTRGQPMLFEVNRGQAGADAQFLARGQGYGIALAPGEAVLSLRTVPNKTDRTAAHSATVRMSLVGAAPDAQLTGVDQQTAIVNYFRGNDPKQWHTKIPTFARVKAERVYPGVDVVYYGNQRQLEFDFVVAPGADSKQIALEFEGAEKLALDAQGNLVLTTAVGSLLQHKPLIYQEVDGVRKEIAGGYVLKNKQQVGFQVAAYDRTQSLIIDPTLSYSTYLGGSGDDVALATAVDTVGNVYVAGYTSSTNFPTLAALQPTSHVGPGVSVDGFVTKLSPAGALIYSTYLGGATYGSGVSGIAVDADGNAYLTGDTGASDFPTTPGVLQPAHSGPVGVQDAFVAKLNASGSALIYSTYLGGTGYDDGLGIAIDSARNALVTGRTATPDFPVVNALQPTYGGAGPGSLGDAFVAKVNSNGTALVYSTYLGGSDDETIGNSEISYQNAIAVDAAGNAYVAGSTASADFLTTASAFQQIHGNTGGVGGARFDAYLVKISPSGARLYSTLLGGDEGDFGYGVAVDSAEQAYVVGGTSSTNFPFQKAVDGLSALSGAFVSKFNASGSALLYSTSIGGGTVQGVAVDSAGHAFVTGAMGGLFPTVCAIQPVWAGGASDGSSDAFVAELAADGGSFIYSTYLGGAARDAGTGIAVDSAGSAYVAGITYSADFPTATALQPAYGGGTRDAFVAKIAASPPCGACSLVFTGFLSPIGGADATGGSFSSPLRTFKLNSTIPVKFSTTCNGSPETTGIHTLQVIKYSNATTPGTPIDATPSDAATTGDQFRLTGTDWHFNIDIQATGMSKGIWLFVATLSDGSQHTAWIQIK